MHPEFSFLDVRREDQIYQMVPKCWDISFYASQLRKVKILSAMFDESHINCRRFENSAIKL